MEHEILLDVRHLTHIFPLSRKTAVKAVDDVSFQIRRGEIFGLVGESGSGKSTAARCVMNIYQPYAGQIYYKGIDTCDRGQFRKNKKMLQTTRQMIFQDSGSSLNQKMKVRDIIEEPMRVQKIRPLRGSYEEEARFQMKYVGLDPESEWPRSVLSYMDAADFQTRLAPGRSPPVFHGTSHLLCHTEIRPYPDHAQ